MTDRCWLCGGSGVVLGGEAGERCGCKPGAEVTYYDPVTDVLEIKVGTHHLSYGGPGDGYCYAHQSFDCRLTEAEQQEVHSAPLPPEGTHL